MIPIQFGQTALILIPSSCKGFANDLTAPTTPCLETAYMGAIGNGYNPAFEDVQIIDPFSRELFFRI
jgi:hypothetical protein